MIDLEDSRKLQALLIAAANALDALFVRAFVLEQPELGQVQQWLREIQTRTTAVGRAIERQAIMDVVDSAPYVPLPDPPSPPPPPPPPADRYPDDHGVTVRPGRGQYAVVHCSGCGEMVFDCRCDGRHDEP